jgi:hypothetical protein
MNTVKSLLLGTAAGLVAVAGAQAADMPVKAAPVQYVKICSLYGDGFYYIPGTDTCLKMGGYLRVQAEYYTGAGGIAIGSGTTEGAQARFARDVTNDVNYRTRAAISWDVRQQTEYGTLRTYIRTGIQITTPVDTEAGNVFWDRAFMQFAGFTVGKTQSFFDLFTYGGGMSYHNVRTAGDTGAAGLTVWAYTAQFGNGVTGTISAESPIGHNRAGVLDVNAANFLNINAATTADTAFSSNAGNGFRMPDIIANLRVDQAWGFLGISGAVHDASGGYYGGVLPALSNCNTATATAAGQCVTNGHPADKLGWAVAVGGQLNLPGGDQVGANFAYAEGATGYVTNIGTGMSLYNANTSVGFGWVSDGVFGVGSEVELTRAWSVNAGYQHIWNARWRTSVFGGYVNIDYNANATALICANRAASLTALFAAAQPVGFNCTPDFSFWEVGTRTQFNPVPQLDIGLEVLYSKLNSAFKGPATVQPNLPRPGVTAIDDQGVWSAMFRWQRNFYP